MRRIFPRWKACNLYDNIHHDDCEVFMPISHPFFAAYEHQYDVPPKLRRFRVDKPGKASITIYKYMYIRDSVLELYGDDVRIPEGL